MSEPVQLSLLDQPDEFEETWEEWFRSLPPMSDQPEPKFRAGAKSHGTVAIPRLEDAA